jgi:hypothetical protein
MMLADPKLKISFGLDKAYVRDSRAGAATTTNQSLLSKGSTKKSTLKMSQPSQRFMTSKSPIDKQDYMEMIN